MFQANQQIGGYTLIKQIGRGGFGEVWLAERRTEILTTRVAVKLPHREQINLEAIRQEAQLWAQASGHANVLPIIEANIYDGQIVIVSEYVPDGSLEEKIQQEIPIKQTLETVIGILNGLDFLHARQIIHRDIKPANILLQGETPRLADFGISRVIKTTVHSTSIVGTPKYMAPEAFDGKRTAQTDIWSVGVILYQMLTGKLPYPQENPTELMWAIVSKEIEPMPESIPPDLRKIVQRALAKVPENRFQSAREMREEVQRALLNISHPTFAPTEVLQKKQLNNETIVDNSIYVNKPVTELPKTVPAPTYLVNPTVDNRSTEYVPMPSTVPAVNPQFQEPVPPTVVQVTELTNKQEWTTARIVQWIFYFLAPVIGGLVTFRSFFEIILIAFPIFGVILGYFFPSAKWKWGIWLNIVSLIVAFFGSIIKAGSGSNDKFFLGMLGLTLTTTALSCLTSYLGSKISPRKPAPALAKPPEEWTTSRIVRWVFYFIAPIIGGLTLGILNKLAWVLMLILPQNFQGDEAASLVQMPLSLIVFGIIGIVFGYVFPQGKWKWGVLLNLLVLVYAISKANIFLSLGDPQRALIIIFLFLISLISSCLTSYLGSWLALRKTNNSP